MSSYQGFSTKAIHAGQDPQQWSHRAVVTPIVMSTTFQLDRPDQNEDFIYSRGGNPTRKVLEKCLAALEGGKYAATYSSGLGATTALTSLMNSGDHVIAGSDIFGGTNLYFRDYLTKQNNIDVTFVDMINPQNVIDALKPNTKMIWLESPTNPTLTLTDIKTLVDGVKSQRPDIIIIVDNTFLTCYYQKPLDFGVDIVMYSLTKYMNGHADIIMGAGITRREDLAQRMQQFQNIMGIIPSPYDCSMVIRSLKTLEVRMERHMKNGLAVAKFLESHSKVEKVLHPLLPSHPQHKLAIQQLKGYSGMISFYMKGNSTKFCNALKVVTSAVSLGSLESLVEIPFVLSHACLPVKERYALGITENLIRMSVGLEAEQDIIADLQQALDVC